VSAAAILPESHRRRSFVYRRLAAAGAHFRAVGEAAVAEHFGDAGSETESARHLGLADLSPLERTGFKGRGALAWLGAEGVNGLDADNRAWVQPRGGLAARLAPGEALLLDGFGEEMGLSRRLDAAWAVAGSTEGCYPVPRREGSFQLALAGEASPALMAKLCGIDLRPRRFAEGAVAQTSVARTNAIVIRWDLGPVLAFRLLGDCASAEYFWDCLTDAMAEFAGRPVGLAALERLASGD